MLPAADDDGMQCSDHPFRPNPGGICAFCLQEKLGKLVSSSSSSPSFRSDFTSGGPASIAPSSALSLSLAAANTSSTRIPFLLPKKVSAADRGSSAALFKRSKSTSDSTRKRSGFWSFLHLSSSKTTATSSKVQTNAAAADNDTRTTVAPTPSLERKVSRSRSVGCGSRRFSGDFFERISTGLGDCTLRRAESQREGKPKPSSMKERVKCGGIFGGFITTSSSSSSSSSAEEVTGTGPLGHGRSRSWGWALASPMRAFSKPSSGKRDIVRQASDKNATTPNLAAIPSLLAARA